MTKPVTPSEIAVVTDFQQKLYYACPAAKFIAVPNAAKRGQWAARQAKREGMKAGFPDGFVIWPGGGILFVEFKRAKGGKTSENQLEWLDRLERYGFPVALVNSAEDALAILRVLGAPFMEEAA